MCCMESERYKLTVLFLKTFFSSWALSVKLNTRKRDIIGVLRSEGTFRVIKWSPPLRMGALKTSYLLVCYEREA